MGNQTTVPVIQIVGLSKTGKTSLIERLIPWFTVRGLRVAVLKHHRGDFDFDKPGKDSYRFTAAGAALSIITSPSKTGLVETTPGADRSLPRLLSRYIRDVDLCIVEGFKKERGPKIEVVGTAPGSRPVCTDEDGLIAIVSDEYRQTVLPVFSPSDSDGIGLFITISLGLSGLCPPIPE